MGGDEVQRMRDELSGLAHDHLPEAAAEFVLNLARPAVRLRHSERPTSSHLGGSARLPPSTEWPRWNGRPLSLVAVLDLSELDRFKIDIRLPTDGLLHFFYDAEEQQAWGFDPSHRGGWRVLLADRNDSVRTPPPDDALVFPSVGLVPQQTLTIPGWEEPAVEPVFPPHRRRLPGDEEQREAFFALEEAWHRVARSDDENIPNHQIGGWPRLVQSSIWRECHVVSHGLPLGNPQQAADPRVQALPPGEDRWRLLLQLDTDEDVGWMWGDVGTLYFAVRSEPPLRFGETWMIFQCG